MVAIKSSNSIGKSELIFVSHILMDVTASTAACIHCDNLFPASKCLYEHVDTFSLWLQGNRCRFYRWNLK